MAGLPKYSVCVVLLTICALFLVTISLTMFWYRYSDTYDGTSKLAVDYRETAKYSISYWDKSSLATVMLALQVFAILWFLAALLFVGLLTSGDHLAALKSSPVLVLLSAGMIVYFVLNIPGAVNSWPSPTPRLSGFLSSGTYGGVTYTGGPMAGFFVAILACAIQVSAVVLYLRWLRAGKIPA